MSELLEALKKSKSRPKKGAPKIKRAGRHKAKIQKYYLSTLPRKKIRNILKNQGYEAAKKWAFDHGVAGILVELTKER
jgi:uncharacterized protein YukJ